MPLCRKSFALILLSVASAAAGILVWNRATGGLFGSSWVGLGWALGIVAVYSSALLCAHDLVLAPRLKEIVQGAERLAAGDTHSRIDLEGSGELPALAKSINEMADRVGQSRLELERQVAERTEDLRAVLEEVHERSRIAEEVNRRLEQADRRRIEFLTNVSHELRTPLNSILGYVRLLRDGLYEHDEERREFLENTEQSANHLLHMVTDVLNAAQIERGKLAVRREIVHPGDVICDTLRVLDVQFREKGLAVKLEVEGSLMVVADADKLRQVLINLVGNAIRFTDHGTVTIRTGPERSPGRSMVRFEVEDTGEGIPAADLERVFDRFHQVDSRAARHVGGTGLGLAISRELIQLMGGTIRAASDGPGEGAIFFFTLPAARSAVPEDVPV